MSASSAGTPPGGGGAPGWGAGAWGWSRGAPWASPPPAGGPPGGCIRCRTRCSAPCACRPARLVPGRGRASRGAVLGASLVGGGVHELRVSVPNRPGVVAEIALALGRAGVNIADMALSPSEDNRQGTIALWIGGEEDAARAQELIAQ